MLFLRHAILDFHGGWTRKLPQIVKTLEYRRARFNEAGQDLEAHTRAAWAQFATHIDRAVQRRDQSVVTGMRSRDEGHLGFSVYGARFYEGQGIGVIPKAPAAAVDLGERAPGADENFLNSDFAALVRGNHVICLNCGRNGGALRSYLALLFKKAEMPKEAQQFELIRVGNPEKLAMIHAIGVKRIEMKVSIADAAAAELLENPRAGGISQALKRCLGGAFQGLTARDERLEHLREAERGNVTVSINVAKNDLEVAKEGLDHLAAEIADDEEADGYVIELRNTTTIRPDEVTVRKSVTLEAHANSVGVFQAWDAMRGYMEELEGNGQLEV